MTTAELLTILQKDDAPSSLHPDVDAVLNFRTKAVAEDDEATGPTITFIGSSDVTDLEGDVVTLKGLKSLATAPRDLTTYIEHRYGFFDVLGKLADSPKLVKLDPGMANDFGLIRASEPYHAVQLTTEINELNPAALYVHGMAKQDYKVGFSVGMILDEGSYTARLDDKGYLLGFDIDGPIPAEWSGTMIPANCQSYYLSAKSRAHLLKRKGILKAQDSEAELCYVLRSWMDFSETEANQLRVLSKYLEPHGLCIGRRLSL